MSKSTTRAEAAEIMDKLFEDCRVLRGEGQKEYARRDESAYANFNRLAERTGLSPAMVLMIYFEKHIDGIYSWIQGHRSQRESVQGRIKDCVVYLGLLSGLVREIEANEALAVSSPNPAPASGFDRAGFARRLADALRETEQHPGLYEDVRTALDSALAQEPTSGVGDKLARADAPNARGSVEATVVIETARAEPPARKQERLWWTPTKAQAAYAKKTKKAQAAYAKKTKQPLWFDHAASGARFVLVPPGKFLMGSPDGEKDHQTDEGPRHEVTLTKSFYLGATEVTNAQFRRFKGDHRSGDYQGKTLDEDEQPVVRVSWNDAVAYCAWLEAQDPGCGARLPTEAEWEYACRAGTTTARFWGDEEGPAGQFANVYDRTAKAALKGDWASMDTDDGYAVASPVGHYKPNAFGLYDTIGNVWEWCADGKRTYTAAAVTDPRGPEGRGRVLRGGSWNSGPWLCRAAYRCGGDPGGVNILCGFRVVLGRSSPRAHH